MTAVARWSRRRSATGSMASFGGFPHLPRRAYFAFALTLFRGRSRFTGLVNRLCGRDAVSELGVRTTPWRPVIFRTRKAFFVY